MDQSQFYSAVDAGQFYSALGVVWVFGFIAVLLIAWHLRNKRRLAKLQMIHDERMKAMEKGIPLPEFPNFEDEESARRIGRAIAGQVEGRGVNPRWPLGLGVLLIMAGLGFCVSFLLSKWELHNELWSFGLIGVFLGIGMFLYYGLTRTRQGDG